MYSFEEFLKSGEIVDPYNCKSLIDDITVLTKLPRNMSDDSHYEAWWKNFEIHGDFYNTNKFLIHLKEDKTISPLGPHNMDQEGREGLQLRSLTLIEYYNTRQHHYTPNRTSWSTNPETNSLGWLGMFIKYNSQRPIQETLALANKLLRMELRKGKCTPEDKEYAKQALKEVKKYLPLSSNTSSKPGTKPQYSGSMLPNEALFVIQNKIVGIKQFLKTRFKGDTNAIKKFLSDPINTVGFTAGKLAKNNPRFDARNYYLGLTPKAWAAVAAGYKVIPNTAAAKAQYARNVSRGFDYGKPYFGNKTFGTKVREWFNAETKQQGKMVDNNLKSPVWKLAPIVVPGAGPALKLLF